MEDFSIFWILIGVGAGTILGFICHEIASVSYFRQVGDANPTTRTPVCVGGKFYYIVPEREYVNSSLMPHRGVAQMNPRA